MYLGLDLHRAVGGLDQLPLLPNIKPPTLIMAPDRSQKVPVETVLQWQRAIPDCELLVLPSDGYHLAALRPQECARETMAFIARHAPALPQ